MRSLMAILGAAALAACDPLNELAQLDHGHSDTEDLLVVNEKDSFYREASHHGYTGTETYTWRNCGEAATVDVDENDPGCYTEGATLRIEVTDAEGTLVFDRRYKNHRDEHHRDPQPTSPGVPGLWTIVLTFTAESGDNWHDDSSWHQLSIRIERLGECVHDVETSNGNNGVGNGEDPPPPGDPPVNDGGGTGPGSPGSQGGPFVKWKAVRTDDRDVSESYGVLMNGTSTAVDASWTSITAGTFRVTVRDAVGNLVYDRTFAPGSVSPVSEPTASGVAGEWTVAFEAADFTSTGLEVVVWAP